MKKSVIKNIGLFVGAFLIYFLATYPTRNIFTVFSVTDVRPGVALNPLLSMCFGPWAIAGLSVATTLGDYLSGYPKLVLVQGIFFQYIYGYLSYRTWKYLTAKDEHRYRLDNLAKCLKFTATALVFAISSAIGVGYIVYSNFGANGFETAGFVIMNNFDFTMVIGMPLVIVTNLIVHRISSGELRKLSFNEVIILINVLLDIIALGLIISFTYKGFAGTDADVYTIWNTIYYRAAIAINTLLVLTLTYMNMIEKKK